MTQKHLDYYLKRETSKLEVKRGEPQAKQPVRTPYPSIPESYLVSISYSGEKKKASLKLYDNKSKKVRLWFDETGHKPYCLTDLSPLELEKIPRLTSHPGFDRFDIIKKYDPLKYREVSLTKIVAKDPLAIGGRPSGCIREIIPQEYQKIAGVEARVWEAAIKYYESYIYDENLSLGMLYKIIDNKLIPVLSDEVEASINRILKLFKEETGEERKYVKYWARLLEYPAPSFRRVALDIEVYSPISTRVPDPRTADYQVVCVSLLGSDELKRILLLKREGVREGISKLPPDVKVEYFDSEESLIRAVFTVLWQSPFVVTFNGDDFDLRYLTRRAEKFGFGKDEIPIEVGRRVCLLKRGVHIDLYKFFYNRSIQIYAFSNRYRDVTLNDVGKAILNKPKIELVKPIGELNYSELARYCWRDSEITFELTNFENDLVMKLILVLARISSMPMEDVSRQGVSRWIKNFMYHAHRRRNILIPNATEISSVKGEATTKAIIKGKKYKGAIVVQPVRGVHFNVEVMDFASLYPSIIKIWNLGYQSILCPHTECKKNKVPDTPHWVCEKQRALESLLIGSLRDLRVRWYKPQSKAESIPQKLRNWYSVIQNALKVILNASYGVFGAESFTLYCPPVAEATAAIGRYSITQIVNQAKKLGIEVIYGDTDSVFLKNPTEDQIEKLVKWSEKKLKLNLEVDKKYRYTVFSSRKKNYLGVLEDGSVDVKGLTGKKRHTPHIIKSAFDQMKKRLSQVKTPLDFEEAKLDIKKLVHNHHIMLRRRQWEKLDDLAFHVVLGENPERYKKTTPQHVKAARISQKHGEERKAGDRISFVKVMKTPHVKPIKYASDNEIDVDKYVAYLRSTFDQILDALDLDFDEIVGLTKLERFM